METSNPKSSIVDSIKKSNNILVTVSHNPSVDALAAALGFTLMLNKLEKHATAVFSGAIPPAITFLEPEKTFEGSVSSLRDFIIALDKEKADRLRYKVEGDMVRIYITPYKTTITQKDLQFSEGDYNVDLVLALGVEKQSDLDNAIASHGRILHDADVATINIKNVKSSIGTIDWSDDKASSLCEMLMSLSEALQSNLLDEQISTALLTGIVAATDRFSNAHTTPRVMTMSAQLMAAGANQQLIAEKLQAGGESLDSVSNSAKSGNSSSSASSEPKKDGEMTVQHVDVPAATTEEASAPAEGSDDQEKPENNTEISNTQTQTDQQPAEESSNTDSVPPSTDWRDTGHDSFNSEEEPLMGGTLNATTSEAEEAKRDEANSSRNHTLLNHDIPADSGPFVTATGAADPEPDDVDVFEEPASGQVTVPHASDMRSTKGKTLQPVTMPPIVSTASNTDSYQPLIPVPPELPEIPTTQVVPPPMAYEPSPMPSTDTTAPLNPTLQDLQAEVDAAASASPTTSSIDDARNAVQDAFSAQNLSVGGQVVPAGSLASDGSIAPPPLPPLPDFSTLPPLPPDPSVPHPAAPPQLSDTPVAPPAAAPGQFQIPGQ